MARKATPSTPAPARPKTPRDRIWLELELPRDEAHAQLVVEKANRMLDRLGVLDRFFWQEKRLVFCFGSQSGYTELVERGIWLSLDFLGRAPPLVAASPEAVGRRLQRRLAARAPEPCADGGVREGTNRTTSGAIGQP